jgi:hypothetical protein
VGDRRRMTTATEKIETAKSVEQLQPAESLLPSNMRGALQLKAAAAYIGVSEISVRRFVKRGLLKPNRAMSRLLFSVKELNRFLES